MNENDKLNEMDQIKIVEVDLPEIGSLNTKGCAGECTVDECGCNGGDQY
jgi:hypothetical protein